MRHTFLIELATDHRAERQDQPDDVRTTRSDGIQLIATIGTALVYITAGTPVVRIVGGGLVIGDLCSRSGTCLQDGAELANLASVTSVRRHVLRHCWGDYILVLPESESPYGFGVTRSPSPACDLQCLYSLGNSPGFITSDISLAVRLGLYRRRVDYQYIAHRLTYPNLKTSRTGLQDVNELLPGSTLHVRDGNIGIKNDWHPWDYLEPGPQQLDQNEVASAIRDATRMVVSAWADRDRSVLLELSGGLDSSIVGTCLQRSNAKVSCVSLRTPTPGSDEREYASLIADLLGTDLLTAELQYEDAEFAFPLPEQLVTPVIGPLQHAIDTVIARTADSLDATSYFSGAGGDTVFCYLTNATPAADALRQAGLRAGLRTIQDLSQFHQCTYWKAARLALNKLIRPPLLPYDTDRTLVPDLAAYPAPEVHPWLAAPDDALAGDRQRIFELSATQFFPDSCPRALTRRVRMPLLSQPVVEACLRAPSWMWFTGGQNRALARHAFADALPEQILARKSKGTFTSYLGAVHRKRGEQILGFLLDGNLRAHHLIDARQTQRLIRETRAPSRDSIMRVFQLCTLENWARQNQA